MKPEYLYHGSSRRILRKLIPKQSTDLDNTKENLHFAVYACKNRDMAIVMAIIHCKGVHWSSLKFMKKPLGIVYKGWPKQEYVYLYKLPSESFKQQEDGGDQWYSDKPVKPTQVERLKIEDYLHLVRKANDKETKQFFRTYKHKLKD